VRNIKELKDSAGEVNVGELKARHIDKTPTMTKGLQACCATASKLKPLCLSQMSLSVKARELSACLFREHRMDKTIFIVNEADSLKAMQFSKTWSFN